MTKKSKPTHELKIKDVETGDQGLVGVAWFDEDNGWFSIKLNPGTFLTYESLKGKAKAPQKMLHPGSSSVGFQFGSEGILR